MQECLSIIDVLDKHPSICVAVSSLLAVLISAVISICTTLALKASEFKRMKMERAVQLGIETFKSAYDFAKCGNAKTVLPPEVWILSSLKLMEVLSVGTGNEKKVTEKIKECIRFSRLVETVYEEENKKND